MSVENVKQEGEFKMPKPKAARTPKNLGKEEETRKVDFSTPKAEIEEPIKILIPKVVGEEEFTGAPVVEELEVTPVTVIGEEKLEEEINNNIQEITEEEIAAETRVLEEKIKEPVSPGKQLPENVEKLVAFMEETGGTVEDYVRLNTDYSNVDSKALLRDYYSKTRPHLDAEEIQFLMEDSFEYDEDLEDERDIRKKKLAFKEEVAKAKSHLESIKSKYYEEIKLRPGATQEQQEAFDFFNRYKKNESESRLRHDRFKQETKNLFTNDFKGFEYNVGEKRFRYGIQNSEQVAESQSDINNFVGKFLDKEGNVTDAKSYHKALYTAMNSDKIAQHFYEQGKADAIKEVVSSSKNVGNQPRPSGEVFINGLRVKSISGLDSSKLKIQTRKF